MNPWRQFPLLRLILPVAIGIVAGIHSDCCYRSLLFISLFLFLLLGINLFLPKRFLPYPLRWIAGVVVFFTVLILSFQITIDGKDVLHERFFGKYRPVRRTWMCEITEPVVQKRRSAKVILKVTGMRIKGKWIRVQGKALAYIAKDPRSASLFYGDRLILHTKFSEPSLARNPGGFDNRRYLALRGIYRQTYIRTWEWFRIGNDPANPLLRLALSWRGKMLSVLRESGMSGREYAVAAALLLGYVDEIDPEIMKDYSATGVMHILSVSGMHVGMIFIVLEKMLSFLSRRKYGTFLRAGLVIGFIWIYAMITGLSPAVMRAAAMLSLVVTGGTMKRNPEILNILAASMLLLLFWQPELITDLGFQLSYLAVAGIVIFYPPVYRLFVPFNRIADKIWSIVAVSVAAQIATLPLCLYYFHQFPNYFILTNIIVIPLSNLIIYCGILTLALGGFPWLPVLSAKLLTLLIGFLNGFIHWMGSLPFSVTRGIVFSFSSLLLSFLLIITVSVFFGGKKKLWLFISLALMVLLAGGALHVKLQRLSRSTFTVYDLKRARLIDCTAGDKSILAGDLSAMKDPFFSETVRKYRWNNGIRGLFEFQRPVPGHSPPRFIHKNLILLRDGFLSFSGKRILILDRRLPAGVKSKMDLDYLVLSGNPKISIGELMRCFRVRQIVIDPTNSFYRVKAWMAEARKLDVKCHSVGISGAFTDNF